MYIERGQGGEVEVLQVAALSQCVECLHAQASTAPQVGMHKVGACLGQEPRTRSVCSTANQCCQIFREELAYKRLKIRYKSLEIIEFHVKYHVKLSYKAKVMKNSYKSYHIL